MDCKAVFHVVADDAATSSNNRGPECLLCFFWTVASALEAHATSLLNAAGCWITIVSVGTDAMDVCFVSIVLPHDTTAFCTHAGSECSLGFFWALTGTREAYTLSSVNVAGSWITIVSVCTDAMYGIVNSYVLANNSTCLCGNSGVEFFLGFFRTATSADFTHTTSLLHASR